MSELLKKIEPQHQTYYDQLKNEEDQSRKVGWKNATAQEIRFRQLSKLFSDEVPFTVNDLGCGLGHFLTYMEENQINYAGYNGYDVITEMVDQCKIIHGQNEKSLFYQILESGEMNVSHYTVASGIFNLKHSLTDIEWKEYIQSTIRVMWEKSERGIAFNMLTFYSDETHKKENLYYSSPEEMFTYCAKNITRNIALLHDYRQYDFTVILQK